MCRGLNTINNIYCLITIMNDTGSCHVKRCVLAKYWGITYQITIIMILDTSYNNMVQAFAARGGTVC